MQELTEQQKSLIEEIMRRESRQRRIDEIVENTKIAMIIFRSESKQNKIDKIVERELEYITTHSKTIREDSIFEILRKFFKNVFL